MAGTKRGRNDWDGIEDPEELKEILDRQQNQIVKLQKEVSGLKAALKGQESIPGDKTPEELAHQAAKSRSSLAKTSKTRWFTGRA